jgi:hypothetical protein
MAAREKCPDCNKLVVYHGDVCDPDDIRRHKANQRRNINRKAREDALRSCGLVKVRGARGGIYWE